MLGLLKPLDGSSVPGFLAATASHSLSGDVLAPLPLYFSLEVGDLGCHTHAWDSHWHHGSAKDVLPAGLPFWVDCYETISSTFGPKVGRPTERSYTFSWNRSQTTDRCSLGNGSVEAWQVHGRSTTNSSTCPTLLDEVDDTPHSYSRRLGLYHKTANKVKWDI